MKSALIYSFTIILSIALLQACAPEEPEVQRDQEAIQDSLEQVYQAEMEEMRQDSIAQAREDSIAAEREREMNEEQIEYSETGDFVVQVQAWRSEEKANQQAEEWIEMGYEQAYVVSYGNEETGNIWYRVRIGQFNTREMAERLQEKLSEDHDAVSWVSRTGQPVEEDAMQGN
ncbi:MAG TPA: SPOR domain-containing protein [Balneolaceae bacterium]|nr:SPOR domain-containing protein [Balneolaceae bacterium]